MEVDKNLGSCESYYANEFGRPGSDHSSPEIYGVNDGGGSPDKTMQGNKDAFAAKNFGTSGGASASSRLSSPSSSNSNGGMQGYHHPAAAAATRYLSSSEEGHSVITFRGGQFGNFMQDNGPSLLSFDQHQGFYPSFWDETMHYSNNNSSGNYQNHPLTPKCSTAAASPGHLVENSGSNIPFGWLNPNTDAASAATIQDRGRQESSSLSKRPYTVILISS